MKKIIIILIITITILWGIIEITYKSIIGKECCDCNNDGSMTSCVGEFPTNCIECCECDYDFIKRITTIYNYFTN